MQEYWTISNIGLGGYPPISAELVLLQVPAIQSPDFVGQTVSSLSSTFGSYLPNLLGALVTLVVGWLIALVASWFTKSLLKKTDLDNRLLNGITGGNLPGNLTSENIVSSVVFWIIFLFALLAFLNALNLTVVAQPLNSLLNQVFAFLPKLLSAAVLGGLAWLVATAVKLIVIRSSQSFGLDRRLKATADDVAPQVIPSETLANALYWFVWLFFLPVILQVLDLEGPLAPVQNLLNDLLSALPNILKALLIGAVGWFLAKIVSDIVVNLLTAMGSEKLASQIGLNQSVPGQSLAKIAGNIVYLLILVPTLIAALEALKIQAISGPAIAMLNQVMNTIPQIMTAAGILVVAYFISRFIADLVTGILTSLGFNNIFTLLGIKTLETAKTPAEIAGIVSQVGVMLFAAVAATNILNIPALTTLVSGLLVISAQILVGVVIFAIGLYLANLAYSLISIPGTKPAQLLGQTARIAIIAFVGAMALQQMGIAPNIVNLAFGLLLGAVAIAVAIAFGLGGRDVAAEQLRSWLSIFKQD